MQYTKKILSVTLLLIAFIIIGIASGNSAYMVGYNDGRHIAGRELSAMIYLKGTNPDKKLPVTDAWDMVEMYKNDKANELAWYHLYLKGLRGITVDGSSNYDQAFINGVAPENAFSKKH